MLTQDTRAQLQTTPATKSVYTYCIAMTSKQPDEDGWTTEHKMSIDFPHPVGTVQLKTL